MSRPPARPLRAEDAAPADGGAAAADRSLTRRAVPITGVILAGLAVMWTLRVGRAFFMPVLLAIILALLLRPVVRGLERIGFPNAAAAAVVLIVFAAGTGYAAYRLSQPAGDWLERAPVTLQRVEDRLRGLREPVEEVERAAERLERAASGGEEGEAPEVRVEGSAFTETLLDQAWSLVAGVVVTLFLLYFLLASGDLFLRKLVEVLPTRPVQRKAVRISRDMQRELSGYLATYAMINLGLGAAVAVALWTLGMPSPVLWGVIAALLNFVPYLGPLVTFTIVTLVALVTFDELWRVMAVALVYASLNSLEGGLVTPVIMGRRLQLNPVAVFLALIFWGWMWGIPGALLAVPILTMLKIICDHTERLAPVGHFLGR